MRIKGSEPLNSQEPRAPRYLEFKGSDPLFLLLEHPLIIPTGPLAMNGVFG